MTVVFLLAADKANGGIDKDWDFHADIPDRFVPFLESNMLKPRQTHPPLHTWRGMHKLHTAHVCPTRAGDACARTPTLDPFLPSSPPPQ